MMLITIVMFGLTSGMYMGTVDGWVTYMNGTPAANVHVTAHVVGCSVSCDGSALSDDNGYYLIDNLNMNPGDTVSVEGVKGPYSGSGSGTADAGSVAHVNITLCAPPSPPSLTHQPDISHDYVDLTWVSGIDPDGYATHDVYQFNYNPEVDPATPPQHESGLSLGTYTWRVRTCNSLCCSPWSDDTFNVIPPSQPTLTHQPDTHSDTVNLNWISGTDPEGQPTYDEFFIDSTTVSPATSPQTVTNLSFGSHTWGARTCNNYFCSPWSTDTFTRYNGRPSMPALTPIPDGNYSCVNLTWVSGIDPNGDTTYDQVAYGPVLSFSFSNYTNATSPYEICNVSGTYEWAVRTCDEYGLCSPWNVSYFTSSNCPPCICPPCGGGETREVYRDNGLAVVVTLPNMIPGGSEFEDGIVLTNFGDQPLSNLIISFEDSDNIIHIDDVRVSELSQGEERQFNIHGTVENVSTLHVVNVNVEVRGDWTGGTFSSSNQVQITVLPFSPGSVNGTCENNDDCPWNMLCFDHTCQPVHCPSGMTVFNHGCVVLPECHVDSDCEDNEFCYNNTCVPVSCDCGYVSNHQCYHYECCYDSDCGEGYLCVSHHCERAPENESVLINQTYEMLKTMETWSEYLNDKDYKLIQSIIKNVKEELNNKNYKRAYKLAREGLGLLSKMEKNEPEMIKRKIIPLLNILLILLIVASLLYIYYKTHIEKKIKNKTKKRGKGDKQI